MLSGRSFERSNASTADGRWDHWRVHRELLNLTLQRSLFRFQRTLRRMRSPRHWMSTGLSATFFMAYLLYGVFMLSHREPAGPDRLRLWLSGGMVLYLIYHSLKCVWAGRIDDLELTAAESLWLGGAPLKRSTLAVHHLGDIIASSAMKTVLLAIVIYVDVTHLTLLVTAVFVSLLMLETLRVILQRIRASLGTTELRGLRFGLSLIASATVLLFLSRLIERTPYGSDPILYVLHGFHSLGDVASTSVIQWLAYPWYFACHLAVADRFEVATFGSLAGTLAMLPLMVLVLVWTDDWARERSQQQDRLRLRRHRQASRGTAMDVQQEMSEQTLRTTFDRVFDCFERLLGRWPLRRCRRLHTNPEIQQFIAIVVRQGISIRRYRGEVWFSFLLPTILCLSPLATDHTRKPWVFVVGGLAMCTILLAPAALRLDFRRDLKRMLLLRGLPVSSNALVLGQLFLPIVITVSFQSVVLSVAVTVLGVGWYQASLWWLILPSVAVITFATENTLFLMYPHHEKSQGIAMMLRAKLMFLGKTTLIAMALTVMVLWGMVTQSMLGGTAQPTVFFLGVILAAIGTAAASLFATRWAWLRFDLSSDVPPE